MTDQPGGDEMHRPPQSADKPSTGKLIVVIENDKLVREATAGLLQSWGYGVVAAKSRGAALGSLAAWRNARASAASAQAPRHVAETDSVAGHIGFEVRRETGKE
jgi:nitroreductase